MKQGTLVIRVVVLVLLAAVLIYLGFYLWQGLSDPYQLVVTYAYEMDDDVAVSGVVVRTEEPLQGSAALAEVLPREGERVAGGSTVAMIYQDEAALSDRRRAQAVELELEQLQYAMRLGDNQADAKDLDSQLVDQLAALRLGVSTGALDGLEDRGMDIRGLVVKRTVQADADSLPQLQAAAQELEGELAALNASAARTTRRVTAPRGGIFSGLADGYETVLTPQLLQEATAGELDELCGQEPAPPESDLGKLITDSTWYYAAPLPDEQAQRLEVGQDCDLAFSGDFNDQISMTLERLGPLEDGRRLAVFSCDKYLSRVTLCRFLNARLIFNRFTGVRIPDKALRVRDNGDGTTTPGVYTLVGRQVEFKRVEVIREGEGFYLVQGTDTNRKVLRPGDTIVLSNRELYDGKVVA